MKCRIEVGLSTGEGSAQASAFKTTARADSFEKCYNFGPIGMARECLTVAWYRARDGQRRVHAARIKPGI